MKLWDMLRGNFEQRDAGNDPSWAAMMGGSANASGQHVDARSAESISTVFACVQALSESTACLPLHVYRRTDEGDRERASGHWLARLLDRPNSWQTGMDFRESQTAAVLLHGNAYARKEFNGAGEVTALHPMHPQRVTIVKLPNGRHRYDYTDGAGQVVPLLADDVLHLRDRTEPGSIVGKSRIAVARETLGLSLALRAHGAGVFGRGARPASVITNESQRDLNTEQLRDMQERLQQFATPQRAGGTLILPRNMKWHSVGLSNEDAEWLSAMNFSVTEVCRIFRVPPILVQTLEQASYNNVSELGQQFVRFSLQRWLQVWEQGISMSLLGPIARQRFYAEHSVDALLRGNSEARADFYQKMIASGVMSVDECRKLENLPALGSDATPL